MAAPPQETRKWVQFTANPVGAGLLIALACFLILASPVLIPPLFPGTERTLVNMASGTIVALIGIAGGEVLHFVFQGLDKAESSIGHVMLRLALLFICSSLLASILGPHLANSWLENLGYGWELWLTLSGTVGLASGFAIWIAADDILQAKVRAQNSIPLPVPDPR